MSSLTQILLKGGMRHKHSVFFIRDKFPLLLVVSQFFSLKFNYFCPLHCLFVCMIMKPKSFLQGTPLALLILDAVSS